MEISAEEFFGDIHKIFLKNQRVKNGHPLFTLITYEDEALREANKNANIKSKGGGRANNSLDKTFNLSIKII